MKTKDKIKKELTLLIETAPDLVKLLTKEKTDGNFYFDYQDWYSRSLRIVELLAPDRYEEFRRYYEPNPKRKELGYGTYVIQDFIKGVIPNEFRCPNFDAKKQAVQGILNQLTILSALQTRIDSVLNDVEGGLLAELQDAELIISRQLLKISARAAGAIAGVIIEAHLLKVASKHGVTIGKKSPTISDLNDPLKKASIYDTPTWRKISYLADIRNLCAHKKDDEPRQGQVEELIEGANWVIKTIQ